MHTPNSHATHVGTSKLNTVQVTLTLNLLSAFVKATSTNPSRIVIIAPYKPNVTYANSQLTQKRYPALQGIQPVQTADSFQGCEGDMAVVIFGTTARSGPGFTSDENRLNVMITRQRSALLLVGDMGVTGSLAVGNYRGRAGMLRELLVGMREAGRWFEVGG